MNKVHIIPISLVWCDKDNSVNSITVLIGSVMTIKYVLASDDYWEEYFIFYY